MSTPSLALRDSVTMLRRNVRRTVRYPFGPATTVGLQVVFLLLFVWLAAAGLLALATFALIWFAVALGLVSDSVETASNLPVPLVLLPFLGSGFVPADSLPTALRWFAEYQPFTPVTETVRGLLLGSAIGARGALAVAWCVGITVVSWVWATRLFHRERTA